MEALFAAAIGFVEILIWLMAAGHALQHMDSVLHVIGYAGGFAAGTYTGVWLETKFGFGVSVIRAVCELDRVAPAGDTPLLRALRETGYAVTKVVGRGRSGPVDILNIVVDRRSVPEVMRLINGHAPKTFVTVEEIQTTFGGSSTRRVGSSRSWRPQPASRPQLCPRHRAEKTDTGRSRCRTSAYRYFTHARFRLRHATRRSTGRYNLNREALESMRRAPIRADGGNLFDGSRNGWV